MPLTGSPSSSLVDRLACRLYVRSLIDTYRSLPDTACRPRPGDRRFAGGLFDRGIPLQLARDALLVATARRSAAAQNGQPLPSVRSLHYYRSVIEELFAAPPIDAAYRQYLIRFIGRAQGPKAPLEPSHEATFDRER